MDFLSKSQQVNTHTEIKEEDNRSANIPFKTAPLMEQKDTQFNMKSSKTEAYKQSQDNFLEEDFYKRRSIFTDSSQELMDSLWNGRDSESMQAVKAALSSLMQFHSAPVLSAEQLENLKSYEDKEEGYLYAVNAMKESVSRYFALADKLSVMCDRYIDSHKHVWSDKGQQRFNMVKQIKEMAKADAKQLSKEADGIFSDLGSDSGELVQLLMNKNWESVFSEAKKVRRIEMTVEGANGEEIEHDGKNYVLQIKPLNEVKTVDIGNIQKNTAAYQTAQYLGIEDAFAETFNVYSKNPDDIAIVQEKVKGASLEELLLRPAPVHYSDTAKRQMSNIAVFDCLSGYVNRNADSIIASYSHRKLADGTEYYEIESVKTTDNYNAFAGLLGADIVKAGSKFMIDITKINYIDRRTFDAIMALDDTVLGFLLSGTGMTEESMKLMRERLEYVKSVLRERYESDSDALFRVPASAKSVMGVKKVNEENGILAGGIDTMLNQSSEELDLKVRAAEISGENIQEIDDEVAVENEINIEMEFEQEEDGIDVSLAFGEAEEQHESNLLNDVYDEEQQLEAELAGQTYDNYMFREMEEREGLEVDDAQEQEKEEEISKEEEIHQYDERGGVELHIPGGELLHEKYHSKKEHMKFEGMSYYKQRAVLTEREINVGENLNLMRETQDARLLKESMDKLSSFHTSPVLSEEERKQIDLNKPDTYPLLINMIKASADRYSDMVEEVNRDIRKYIVTHKARTENGKKWIDNLKKLRRMLNVDKVAFKNEVENITYNIGAEKEEIKGILDGNNWLSILSVSRSISGAKMKPIEDGKVQGASGTTSTYEFRGRKYFRKSNDVHNLYGSPMNTVGSYRMAGLLMTDDIYVEAFRVKERYLMELDSEGNNKILWANGNYAIVMEEAKGKMLRELRSDKSSSGIEYSDQAKQQISRLYISDFIMGQMDRKDDNIMMDAEKRKLPDGREYWYVKSIQAIDSDESLIYTREIVNMQSGYAFSPNITMLNYVDKAYYTYIMSLDPTTFAKTSAYAIADIAEGQNNASNTDLIEQTVEIMKSRLEFMQKMLRKMHEEKGDAIFELPANASDIMRVHKTYYSQHTSGNPKNLSEFINSAELNVEVREILLCND